MILISLGIIVSLLILIGAFWANRNFDNDKMNGQYSGSFTIMDQPLFLVNMTFDGKGNLVGIISLESGNTEFSGAYQCVKQNVNIHFDAGSFTFSCEGVIEANNLIIRGQVEMYITEDNYSLGNFFISKVA